uniref:Uncharacterized protein n=1 Tax=Arundo donax TaxID=35708 RepID=A0A0A8YX42_ARUDO
MPHFRFFLTRNCQIRLCGNFDPFIVCGYC